MLTFFRRIRKGLLGEGATSKYVLYAIGEIALVVIGILIALQINNWNEWRKDRDLENYYLLQLKQELLYNLDMAEYGIEFQKIQFKNANILLSVIEGDTSISNSRTLSFAIVQTGWTHRVAYINNIWNELNSTGHIALIRENELRRELADMHRMFDATSYFNSEFNQFCHGFRRGADKILNGSLMARIAQNMNLGESEEKIEGFPEPQAISNSLQKTEGLSGYLSDIIQGRHVMLMHYEGNIEKINQILEMIERQI